MIIKFLKRMFCKHRNQDFIRNIYGDEIIASGWNRSLWHCKDGGKIIENPRLMYER